MKMNIPEPARKIIDRLNEHGYEAYVVGGCVRDMILKREPGDWDITTSARPEQVKALFNRTLDTGIQHLSLIHICAADVRYLLPI